MFAATWVKLTMSANITVTSAKPSAMVLSEFLRRSAYEPGWSLLIGMAALNLLLIVAWNLSGVLIHGRFLRRLQGHFGEGGGP